MDPRRSRKGRRQCPLKVFGLSEGTFLFYVAQYFAFAAGRAGEALRLEADVGEHTAYSTFGTVGGQHSSGLHGLIYLAEYGLVPHLGLLLGGEGVEVHRVKICGQFERKQIVLNLRKREVRIYTAR